MAGKTDDNIEALEILTYDGQRHARGCDSEEDFNRILTKADAARNLLRTQSIADRYGDHVRRQFRTSSPRFRIQPEPPAPGKRLPRGPGAGRNRRHLPPPFLKLLAA